MTCFGSSLWVLLSLGGLVASAGQAAGQGPAGPPDPEAERVASPPAGAATRDRLVMLPTVAAAIGPVWPLTPAGSRGLAVDATVGAVIGWPGAAASPVERYLKGGLWLQPELGYTFQQGSDSDPRADGHLGSLGLGVGYGSLLFMMGDYTPRLVVGALGGELAVGLRHGLGGHFLGRLFSVELSHQMLWVGDQVRHELRLLFGLNGGALFTSWL